MNTKSILTTPPHGMKWHRYDFTLEMLPPGWRPLLHGEPCQDGDEVWINGAWNTGVDTGYPMGIMHAPTRTQRPLPDSPSLDESTADQRAELRAFGYNPADSPSPPPFDLEWNCPTHFAGGDPKCPACIAKQPKPAVAPGADGVTKEEYELLDEIKTTLIDAHEISPAATYVNLLPAVQCLLGDKAAWRAAVELSNINFEALSVQLTATKQALAVAQADAAAWRKFHEDYSHHRPSENSDSEFERREVYEYERRLAKLMSYTSSGSALLEKHDRLVRLADGLYDALKAERDALRDEMETPHLDGLLAAYLAVKEGK